MYYSVWFININGGLFDRKNLIIYGVTYLEPDDTVLALWFLELWLGLTQSYTVNCVSFT